MDYFISCISNRAFVLNGGEMNATLQQLIVIIIGIFCIIWVGKHVHRLFNPKKEQHTTACTDCPLNLHCTNKKKNKECGLENRSKNKKSCCG